ncbi:hypothetical protein [Massilioclostridium coli]|uniref:hypothetical protein n=1 Tax=Massilioclostridium coli TaxID=1870991 RepID=UPI00085BD194|nr:hypothetical protein [Massilioclostridium coli]
MKRIRIALLLFCCMFFVFPSIAFAFPNNIKTSTIRPDKQQTIWNNTDLHITTEQPEKHPIPDWFAVSENGWVAISSFGEPSSISIYNPNYEFQSIIYIDSNTDVQVDWKEDNLILIFGISTVMAEITLQGELVDMNYLLTDDDNTRRYYYEYLGNHTKISNGITYRLQNSSKILDRMLFVDKNQLVRVNLDGTETIIYDATVEQKSFFYVKVVIAIVLIGVCAMIFIPKLVQLCRN